MKCQRRVSPKIRRNKSDMCTEFHRICMRPTQLSGPHYATKIIPDGQGKCHVEKLTRIDKNRCCVSSVRRGIARGASGRGGVLSLLGPKAPDGAGSRLVFTSCGWCARRKSGRREPSRPETMSSVDGDSASPRDQFHPCGFRRKSGERLGLIGDWKPGRRGSS